MQHINKPFKVNALKMQIGTGFIQWKELAIQQLILNLK